MKKGQTYVGRVEKVIFPNKGIIKLEDGKTVVVKNVTSGQKISFSINKVRKGKGEGRLLEVLEKSPLELESVPCEHFGVCGGCTFFKFGLSNSAGFERTASKRIAETGVCSL